MNTPADGKTSPAVTDRGLFCLAISAGDPGIGWAIAQIHNHFQKQLDAIPMSKPNPEPEEGKEPCGTCGKKTGFPYAGMVWCCNTRCSEYHTVFTTAEWQQRGKAKLIEARNSEY